MRLLPRIDQRLMWCNGYLRKTLPEADRRLKPSSPTSATTGSDGPPSSGDNLTLNFSPGMSSVQTIVKE